MSSVASGVKSGVRDSAKERILSAAYRLFTRQGTRTVGVDTVVERSGVAKMSLYRHFRSKQDLVTAFLARRESLWTIEWLKAEISARAASPEARLLAVFDLFDDWFQADAFEGCSFVNVLLEYPPKDPVREAAAIHLANIRAILVGLATDARIADPQDFADTWHILMKGSIVAACEGNRRAARQAKNAARLYLDSCLPA